MALGGSRPSFQVHDPFSKSELCEDCEKLRSSGVVFGKLTLFTRSGESYQYTVSLAPQVQINKSIVELHTTMGHAMLVFQGTEVTQARSHQMEASW